MINKERFMDYLFEEFPGVFDTNFAWNMLENIIDYANNNTDGAEDSCLLFLLGILPEISKEDIKQFYTIR